MSDQSQSYVRKLREAGVERLRGYAALQGIPVLHRQVGDFEAQIDEVMAAGVGCCVTVFTPVVRKIMNGARGPFFKEILWRVKFAENPVLNQTALDAETGAELIIQRLHLWQFTIARAECNPLLCADPATDDSGLGGVDIMEFYDGKPRVKYTMREIDCLFLTSGGLLEIPNG